MARLLTVESAFCPSNSEEIKSTSGALQLGIGDLRQRSIMHI